MHRIGRSTSNYRPSYSSNVYSSDFSNRLRSKSFDDSYRYKSRYSGSLSRRDVSSSYYGKSAGITKSYHDNKDDSQYKSYHGDVIGGAEYGRYKPYKGDIRGDGRYQASDPRYQSSDSRYNISANNDLLNGKTKFAGVSNESQVDLSNDSLNLNDCGSTKATYKVVGRITQSSTERNQSKAGELLLPSVKANELNLKQNDSAFIADRSYDDGGDRYTKCVKSDHAKIGDTNQSYGREVEDYRRDKKLGRLTDDEIPSRKIDEFRRLKDIETIGKDSSYRNPKHEDRYIGKNHSDNDFPSSVRKPIRLGFGLNRPYSRDDSSERLGNEYGNDDVYHDGRTHREQARNRDGKRTFSNVGLGLPKVRSRSADAIDSRKTARTNKDGLFPVCSRYPNCSVCVIEIPQNKAYKENVIQSMQEELKEENENIILVEKKDKEIHLKSETISQLTQILERTKKELQIKSVECQRQELTIKQLRDELRAVVLEKKEIETKHNSQQIYLSKLELCETQLAQLTAKYDECCIHNHELIERVKNLEIGEKEFIDLERNLIELQVQLRDMEDVELHRDELLQKLNFVKKQRDEFLEKGRIVEEERNEFVRSNKTLEQYIIEWKKKTAEFKRTNQALKDRILNLERDKKELEDRVLEIQTERSQALAALNKIEVERDDLYRQLREVTAERNAAEARLADLEDYLSDHDHLEEGFHSLRLKVSELTRQRDDAEMLIPSYKVKVQTLKKKLREKEDSIMQLTHDIKKLSIAIENQTYIDLKQIKSISNYADNTKYLGGKSRPQGRGIVNYFSDSPNKHLNPSTSGDSYEEVVLQPNDTYSDESYTEYSLRSLRQKPRQYIALFNYEPKRSRELRLTKGDYVEVYGDVDTDGFYYAEVNGARGLVPSVYVEDVIEDDSSVNIYRGDRSPRYQSHGTNVRERKFVALYDYDPFTMGTTDRPDLQLSLTKGDKITVIGDIDVDGYYTALKKGARYLVPSNFVKEVSSQPHDHSHRHEQNHVHNNVVAKHSELPPNSHVSSANIGSSKIHKSSNNNQTFKGIIEVDEVVGPPYAPEDLKVHRVVTKQAVLLGWKLPVMNEYGQSNRCRVIGYRIWVNGKPKQDIKSATVTKALIEGLDLHGRVEFSIQTIGENGFCSEKCHFAITGALSTLTKENELLHQQNGDIYVALYDYDPFKSSPNPNPSLELKLSEGDLIKVTDKTRNDGFYFAEIRGNKGLVPSNFIERVNVSSSGHQIHEYDSQNRRVQFERGSTK